MLHYEKFYLIFLALVLQHADIFKLLMMEHLNLQSDIVARGCYGSK